jgi:hypothetical protein
MVTSKIIASYGLSAGRYALEIFHQKRQSMRQYLKRAMNEDLKKENDTSDSWLFVDVCWAFNGKDCHFRDFYSTIQMEKEKEEAAMKKFSRKLVMTIVNRVERLIYYGL